MPIYTVKSQLMHDNTAYNEGDELELRENQAGQLLASGVLAAKAKAVKGKE